MDSALPVVVPPLAAVLVALLAAGMAWTVSTPLVRAADSPTLPERLLQWTARHRWVAVLASVPLLLSGWHALWAIPLAWLGLQITAHRVRRRIFGDTWSFAAQVWWNGRVFLAGPAYWLALAVAPGLLLYADASPALVLATGGALAAWGFFYNDVLCVLLGARSIDAAPLRDAFELILARAAIRRPRLVHAGPRGGTQINAFALGALRGDAVLFLDGLLAQMTPVEAAAVLAHEIGHLEDFAARRWQVYGLPPLLLAGGMAVALAAGGYRWPDWIGLPWAAVVLVTLLARLAHSQQRETDSDRRAVELCGDGEALIRALEIIHSRSRVPRRFHPEFAAQATHPSLARRIQAIRAMSGAPPASIEPRAFAGDGVTQAVVFETGRIVFVTYDGERPDLGDLAGLVLRARQVDGLPYEELSSLHIEPRREDGAVLVAVDRRSQARRLRLADADVTAVQAMLDIVDPRLGPPLVARASSTGGGRAVALIAILAALPAMAWGLAVAALAALIRPSAPLLAAVATGSVMATVVHSRGPLVWWLPILLGVISGSAAFDAWRHMAHDRAAGQRFRWDGVLLTGAITLAVLAVLPTLLMVHLGATDLERLHVVARALPSAATAWAALAGLCVAVPRRWARIVSVAAFGLAVAVSGAGSNAFRDRFAPDPLVATAPALVVRDLTSTASGRLTAAGAHGGIALAPDAAHVVLASIDGEGGRGRRYTVAGFDGWLRGIDAEDVRFVDAATLLVTRRDERGLLLSTEAVRTAGAGWSLRIDGVTEDVLVDADPSGRWRLEPRGRLREHDRWVRLDGRVGTTTIERTETAAANRGWIALLERGVASSGAEIVSRIERPADATPEPRLAWFFTELIGRTVIERRGGSAPGVLARSRLQVDCSGPSLRVPAATCLARAGNETFVWEIPAEAGAPQLAASMSDWAIALGQRDRGVLVVRNGELLLLWRGSHEAVRLSGPDRPGPHDAAFAAGHLATLTREGDRDAIVRYPLAPR